MALFVKGQSGNPGGRSKEDKELKRLAQEHTVEAINRLVYWMRSDRSKASIDAIGLLLERGYGKAPQPLVGDSSEDPINIAVMDGRSAVRTILVLAAEARTGGLLGADELDRLGSAKPIDAARELASLADPGRPGLGQNENGG